MDFKARSEFRTSRSRSHRFCTFALSVRVTSPQSLAMAFVSTFFSGEPALLVARASASSLKHAPQLPPANLRFVRPVTFATASDQATASRRKPRGIMKPRSISPEMQALVGVPEISRTQALKVIWTHIKEHNLQRPDNKKIIVCDEKLKKIFGGKDEVGFLDIAGLISPHFL
ncbi:uncharacterized protein LOC111017291 [Momordica charantia]|uniref:Uncharacterized protein LOC111017291 n=1 Tax=Momordica charantia TaxID=3673 RepID=A0A6J1D4Q4_MOMCH|nr:uncharacterized protein LOC111017291 [Momordica charantia]